MSTVGVLPAVVKAAEAFNLHEHRRDGLEVAGRLASGLTALRESLLRRLVESDKGSIKDSMLVPTSQVRAQQMAVEEVEAFLIAESTAAAAQFALVKEVRPWYLAWLTAMRLETLAAVGDVPARVAGYLEKTPDQRRLDFSDILVNVVPEARRAPLVIFRLLPLAAQIATVQAFGDQKSAESLRREQAKILPSIGYCKRCQGKLLGDGKKCPVCGNPLWDFGWISSID